MSGPCRRLVFAFVVAVLCPSASAALAEAGWYPQDSPISTSLTDVDFVDAESGWICGAGGVILHTDDGGGVWTQQNSGTTADLRSISFVSRDVGFACGNTGILRTTNSGLEWETVLPQGGPDYVLYTEVQALNVRTVWAVGRNLMADYGAGGVAVITTDGGASWFYGGVSCSPVPCHTDMQYVFAFSETEALVSGGFTVGGDHYAKLWKTIDGGHSFFSAGSPLGVGNIQFLNPSVGYRVDAYAVERIAKTTNGGASWTSISIGDAAATLCFVDPERGWVAGYAGSGCVPICGIARTTDGGVTWTQQETGAAQYLGAIDFVNPWVGAAVGPDGTILHTVTGGESGADVSTLERSDEALLSAAPNPSSRSVRIDFISPEGMPVAVSVFDAAGRLVRELRAGAASSGSQSVVWDGTDASGRPATAAAYFVRLATARGTCRRNLLVLR